MEYESHRFFSFQVEQKDAGLRLDVFLSSQVLQCSRSRIQELIKSGFVQVNAETSKVSHRLQIGDSVRLTLPPPDPIQLAPESVDFGLVYEDTSLIVLNKPPGLVVHPAPGHRSGTLVHGLLEHCKDLSGIGGVLRPGIVHRLDKDTSGLIVVAKNDQVHQWLSEQFAAGKIKKEYLAIVHGVPKQGEGGIDAPITRHPRRRKEMAVVSSGGKRAITFWKMIRPFGDSYALLSISPRTGRTHQIRVHLAHLGYPILGDPVYGYRRDKRDSLDPKKRGLQPRAKRQMLHAGTLGFLHPKDEEYCEFSAPLPEDMRLVLDVLHDAFE
ncbi:MAG: RluA family pseudouridine synthase [Desulfatiglandales bacterium]